MVSQFHIAMAARVLHGGGVIAYPTEGVWGLGCDPNNSEALMHLFTLKKRRIDKGVILVAANMQQIAAYCYALTDVQYQRLQTVWPAHVSVALPDPEHRFNALIRGRHASVVVRVSEHPVIRALCCQFAHPLVSTSANISAMPAALSSLQVRKYFMGQLDYIVPGKLSIPGKSSVIEDIAGRRLR